MYITNLGLYEWLLFLGKTGEYQVIMKKIQLDLVPQPVCENQLRATRLGQYFNLDPSFTCAGGKPGKDTCTGILKLCFISFIYASAPRYTIQNLI